MTKLIKLILEKIERTDVVSTRSPTGKVQQGEVVEFILENEELKKLYVIMMHESRNLERAVLEYRRLALDCEEKNEDPGQNPDVTGAREKMRRLLIVFSVLHSLFWDSLTFEHLEFHNKPRSIRENWQIVSGVNPEYGEGLLAVGISADFVRKVLEGLGGFEEAPKPTGKKPNYH